MHVGDHHTAAQLQSMLITTERTNIPLLHTFTIARGSFTFARTLLLHLEHDDVHGIGEASPISRYGESIESVIELFAALDRHECNPFDFESMLAKLPPAARCALDLALHDWIGKRLNMPLCRYFGLDPARAPLTSFTIGIDTTEKMLAKLDEVRDAKILKIKLGTDRDIEIVDALRSRYTGTLRIDANEAWEPEQAAIQLRELARFDIELCEQPIKAGRREQLRWVQEHSAIPIVTDEDSCSIADIEALRGCVAGVNIKLVKIGGLRAAIDGIRTARALGLKVMLGCMVESSVLATAAAHIASLVDWADIDGPFLTADDPYHGLKYEDGRMILPTLPGLGVTVNHAFVKPTL
jgi:L-alanine-DL-glutamate epimerase-like enolase superfamily enzyme